MPCVLIFLNSKRLLLWRQLARRRCVHTGQNAEDEKRFKENEGLFWTEPSIFRIFDYRWLAGNATGLKDPNTVVLAESLAKRFYGSAESALGNTIQLWSFRVPLRITGVFRDIPANTDIPIKFAASYATLRQRLRSDAFTGADAWNFNIGSHQCFVLTKNQSIKAVESQLESFVKKYYKDDPLFTRQLSFQPLSDMHLNSDFSTYANNALSVKELWSLRLIGLFLLLVACINFINLSTAQSVNRSREIGVRKVLGSDRSQLIYQFLQETFLVTVTSVILGCVLAFATLPLLNNLLHKGLSLNFLTHPLIILYLVFTCIVVTLLAGFYPALVLSGFNPVLILKNKITAKGGKAIYLRRGLVVFQFMIAQMSYYRYPGRDTANALFPEQAAGF